MATALARIICRPIRHFSHVGVFGGVRHIANHKLIVYKLVFEM